MKVVKILNMTFSNQKLLILKENIELFEGYKFLGDLMDRENEELISYLDAEVEYICSNNDNELVLHIK